jgi:hypothetical protein
MPKKRKSPDKTSYRLEKRSGEFDARWRTGNSTIGCFMLIWMSGWSAGCCFLAYMAWTERTAEVIVGTSVFWCGWLIGFLVLIRQWFGRESIHLSVEGVRTTSSAIFRRTQRAPLAEIVGFGTVRDDGAGGDEVQKRLDVRTVGRPLRVGEGLTGQEVSQLVDELREMYSQLRGSYGLKNGYPREAATIVFRDKLAGELLPAAPQDEKKLEVRTTSEIPVELPSDSRLKRYDDLDAVTVWRRGKFHFGAVVAVLVIAGFWIGIVGIFFHELWFAPPERRLVGVEWIWRFVFLIPFEVVGAVMLFGVILIIVEPFRVWTRRFSSGEVLDRLAWFGVIRFQKRHPVGSVDRIDVLRVPYEVPKFPKRLPLASLWAPPGCATYDVVPIDPTGKEVCRIEGLTFGEACWMADTLLRKRGEWFR